MNSDQKVITSKGGYCSAASNSEHNQSVPRDGLQLRRLLPIASRRRRNAIFARWRNSAGGRIARAISRRDTARRS